MRKRNDTWVLIGCFCLAGSVAAEDFVEPTWKEVRAWALNSSAVLKVDAELDAATVGQKKDDEDVGKDVVVNPADPVWNSKRPDQRRPVPARFKEWAYYIKKSMEKSRKVQVQREKLHDAFISALRMDDIAWSINILVQMLTAKRSADRDSGFVYFNLWMIAISTKSTDGKMLMPRAKVVEFYEQWRTHRKAWILKRAENPKWGYQKSEENKVKSLEKFFEAEGETLGEAILEAEKKGDLDPVELWKLCGRFSARRPYRPQRYLKTLVKLRAWYPSFKAVASGEVQWRIAQLLYGDELQYHEAAGEYEMLMEKFKNYKRVKDGTTLWMAADSRHKEGRSVSRSQGNAKGFPILKKALGWYRMLQTDYPKHAYHRPHVEKQSHPGVSECQFRINGLELLLREKKKR